MRFLIKRREGNVLLVVGICLLLLWLLGFGGSNTLGGFLHFALLAGIICVAVSLVTRFRGPPN